MHLAFCPLFIASTRRQVCLHEVFVRVAAREGGDVRGFENDDGHIRLSRLRVWFAQKTAALGLCMCVSMYVWSHI